jgi:hypothetical protein
MPSGLNPNQILTFHEIVFVNRPPRKTRRTRLPTLPRNGVFCCGIMSAREGSLNRRIYFIGRGDDYPTVKRANVDFSR